MFFWECKINADDPNEELTSFLKNRSIFSKNGLQVIVFIPNNQCANCVFLDGRRLSDYLNEKTYVVIGFKSKNVRNFKNLIYDKSNKHMSLEIVDYENKIVVLTGGRVVYVKPFYVNAITRDNITSCDKR